jgi:hypothetical protein
MANRRWFCGLAAAVLVPTILTTAYFSAILLASPYPSGSAISFLAIVAFVTSLLHVVFLAWPGLIFLSRKQLFSFSTVCIFGFVAGCLPIGILTWPLQSAMRGASDRHWGGTEMVSSIIDGVPTLTGWISYATGVGSMGLLGAVAGLAFWMAWQRTA